MGLIKNSEIRNTALLLASVCVIASVAAFFWRVSFGIFTLTLCVFFCTVWYIQTRKRYKKIAEFTSEIDAVLHGCENVSFDQFSEGELSLLQSELQKLTVRLREQNELLRADKIRLSDSIADISHQIRTPLTSINLIVSFLGEPELSAEKRGYLVRELSGLLKRIDRLISALLKISKLDAGTVTFKQEHISIASFLKEACEPLLIPIELRNQILTVKAEGYCTIDPAWTAEAIGNILKNCMEHTPEGGTLLVEGIETALFSEITIADNGCGIDPHDMPHIFERFYKGKNSSENSVGIGLALARIIITTQNGTVKAAPRNGGGTIFTIRFYKKTDQK